MRRAEGSTPGQVHPHWDPGLSGGWLAAALPPPQDAVSTVSPLGKAKCLQILANVPQGQNGPFEDSCSRPVPSCPGHVHRLFFWKDLPKAAVTIQTTAADMEEMDCFPARAMSDAGNGTVPRGAPHSLLELSLFCHSRVAIMSWSWGPGELLQDLDMAQKGPHRGTNSPGLPGHHWRTSPVFGEAPQLGAVWTADTRSLLY